MPSRKQNLGLSAAAVGSGIFVAPLALAALKAAEQLDASFEVAAFTSAGRKS